MIQNILITGQKQSGKSTLVKDILNTVSYSYAGFLTLPFQEYDIGKSYVMKDLLTFKQQPISYYDGKQMQGIPETFSSFGVRCLKHAIESDAEIIVMDELGRFEKNCFGFLKSVNDVLNEDRYVLAVLKAEPIAYLEKMKLRDDCLLIDLDVMSYHESKMKCLKVFNLKEKEKEDGKRNI